MPGETPSDAIGAALALRDRSIGAMLTYLGENVSDPAEAQSVTEHYLDLLDRIRKSGLGAEVSVKLTQLGLDLSPELCHANLTRIIEHADAKSVVWIDMEASNYVDATLALYRRARAAYPNVGVCLQAYLYCTAEDLRGLIPLGAAIRLVKGAYKEPADRAFPHRSLLVSLVQEAAGGAPRHRLLRPSQSPPGLQPHGSCAIKGALRPAGNAPVGLQHQAKRSIELGIPHEPPPHVSRAQVL